MNDDKKLLNEMADVVKESVHDEAAEQFQYIMEQMKDLLQQAHDICKAEFGYDSRYERAKGYWIAQIKMAIDDDHEYMGRGSHTMAQTLDEIKNEVGDEPEEGPEDGITDDDMKAVADDIKKRRGQ